MKKLTTGLLCLASLNTQANVIQYFAGISYNNPSQLFQIKDVDFLIGGTGSYADLKFTGSALNFNTGTYESGVNNSRTYTFMPYGRLAKRFSPKTVFAIDVTEPFNSNLDWGNDAFTRYAATQNLLTDVDISPKVAYSINQQWHIGGGINFNILTKNEANWAFPTGQTTYANLVNHSSSTGVGYNLGITYNINQTNFIDLAYYSRIEQDTSGTSHLGSLVNNNLLFKFYMPATTILSYVHIFNPKWLINLKAFQSEWDANQYARFYNTAAPGMPDFVFTMQFEKSYALLAAVRNQFNEKLGLTLVGLVDYGPEKEQLRNLVFPSSDQYFVALVGDYRINKNTAIELLVGQGFANPTINNEVTLPNNAVVPFTTGKVNINATVIDLKLKYQV